MKYLPYVLIGILGGVFVCAADSLQSRQTDATTTEETLATVQRIENRQIAEMGKPPVMQQTNNVTVPQTPTEAELRDRRIRENTHARWLSLYGEEHANLLLHAGREDRQGSGAGRPAE